MCMRSRNDECAHFALFLHHISTKSADRLRANPIAKLWWSCMRQRSEWEMWNWRKILFADINSNHMAVNVNARRHHHHLFCVMNSVADLIENFHADYNIELNWNYWLSLSTALRWSLLLLLLKRSERWWWKAIKEKETWAIVKRQVANWEKLLQKFSFERNKFFSCHTRWDYQLHFLCT